MLLGAGSTLQSCGEGAYYGVNDKIRILTEKEMRQIEQWARQTRLAEMLSFFEALPRLFSLPRPVLLGSNNQDEILVEGLTSKHRVTKAISNLDEPFNPTLRLQKTLMAKKREKSIGVMQPIYQELSKGFEKVCLAQGLGGCRGNIIRAHTLQKASFKAHACNGHVYEINPFDAEPEGLRTRLVGINNATTFTGFCEHHDSNLFKPIETRQFDLQPQQFFMYHYRAVALAYYTRPYKAKIFEKAYAENSKRADVGPLKNFEQSIFLNKLEAEELRGHMQLYEHELQPQNWSAVEGHAWTGTKVPDFFAADFFGPRKDLRGKFIQDTKSLRPLRWLSLTVTASDDRALVLLCAEKGSPLLSSCLNSLKQLPRDRRTMAVVNYIICQLENFIMLPGWWDALGERTKRQFLDARASRYFPRDLPHVCEWGLSAVQQPANGGCQAA